MSICICASCKTTFRRGTEVSEPKYLVSVRRWLGSGSRLHGTHCNVLVKRKQVVIGVLDYSLGFSLADLLDDTEKYEYKFKRGSRRWNTHLDWFSGHTRCACSLGRGGHCRSSLTPKSRDSRSELHRVVVPVGLVHRKDNMYLRTSSKGSLLEGTARHLCRVRGRYARLEIDQQPE